MNRGRHLRKRRKLKKSFKLTLFAILFLALFLIYGLWPRDGHGGIKQDSASPSDIYEDHEIDYYTISPTAVQIVQPTPSTEPIELTVPIEPTEPIELTELTEPTEPIEPAPSIESTESIEPIEPIEPAPEIELRYGFTEGEIYLLAQLLCGDENISGDGEYDIDFAKEVNYNEVSKVLAVVMNRVRSTQFPNTAYDVVMQKNQFSVMPANASKVPSEKAIEVVEEWCKAYDSYDGGIQVCPESHLYFSGNGKTNTTR